MTGLEGVFAGSNGNGLGSARERYCRRGYGIDRFTRCPFDSVNYFCNSVYQYQSYMIGIKSMTKALLLVLLCVQAFAIFPAPRKVQLVDSPLKITLDNSCAAFEVHLESDKVRQLMPHATDQKLEGAPGQYYFEKVMNRIKNLSKCKEVQSVIPKTHKIFVNYDESIKSEGYKIKSQHSFVQIYTSTYSGYVYALETLSQMITDGNTIQLGLIEDDPIVSYRGIMIDPVRHFIGLKYIRKLIEAMPLSKLNIVHWLFSNDEAFVLNMIKHPELSEASRYSPQESYNVADVKELISFARINAVSIVPEFDTPGHVRSWGLDKKWKESNITILCPGGEHYNHQFDVSKDDVYTLAKEVLVEADSLFKDSPFIHLGGDEVFGSCWDLRPAIKTFMALKNIKNYGELQMYWRYQLKQALPASRKVIFWRNDADNLTTGPDDVVQYWGAQAQTANVTGKSTSKLVLSPSDYLYLNKGTTWIWMNKTNGPFTTWRQIYVNFTVRPEGVDPSRILGAEVCLWNEVQNEDTFENEIWMRASAFAAKIWRNQVVPIADLVTDLVALQKTLISMGIQPSPITNEYCEIYPKSCFPTTTDPMEAANSTRTPIQIQEE